MCVFIVKVSLDGDVRPPIRSALILSLADKVKILGLDAARPLKITRAAKRSTPAAHR